MPFFDEISITNSCVRKDNNCYIKAAGLLKGDPDYLITREESSTNVYAFILSGKMHIQVSDGVYTLLPGDCYVIPSMVYSKVFSDFNEPSSMLWINCEGTVVDSLYKAYFGANYPVIAVCDIESEIKKIMELLKEKNNSDELTILLHKIILKIKNSLKNKVDRSTILPSTTAQQIACYITTHIQEKFDTENICKAFYISVSKLNELFRKEFSCTPHQYYQNIRITIAKDMLIDTDLSIDEIASKLNFVDRNHFTKFFTSKEGVSPATFRKKNK